MESKSFRVIGACVFAFFGALGCSAADGSETGEDVSLEDSAELEQPSTMPSCEQPPPGPPGPPCTQACARIDPTGAIANTCCICNGVARVFRQHPRLTNYYYCL